MIADIKDGKIELMSNALLRDMLEDLGVLPEDIEEFLGEWEGE